PVLGIWSACGLGLSAARSGTVQKPMPPTPVVALFALLCAGNLAAFGQSAPAPPGLSHQPLYWFAPLPPLPMTPGRPFIGSDDFMSLFTPDADWAEASGHLQVFKLYGEWVAYHATDQQLRRVVADLQRRGLALA